MAKLRVIASIGPTSYQLTMYFSAYCYQLWAAALIHTFPHIYIFGIFIWSFLLLHLHSQHWVLHSSSQHSKEEGGDKGAEVEGHPGDGVGQHNFLPLPVHRLHNLIGQDGWAHTMGQLAGDNCGGKDKYRSVYELQKKDIPNTIYLFPLLQKQTTHHQLRDIHVSCLLPTFWSTHSPSAPPTPVVLLTCSQGVGFRGGLLNRRRIRGVDESMTDGADNNPILLHLGPQAVKEGLSRVFWGCVWQQNRFALS